MLLSLVGERKRWLRRFIGVVIVIIFLFKFIFGSLAGVLALSWLLYVGSPQIIGIEPWNFRELILWFDELGNDAKIGLASSMVTVLGFFIALHTTMHSWQRQTAATMRMSAADAIDQVITELNAILLRISLFTEATAKEVKRVRAHGLSLDANPILSVLSEDVAEFRANRQRLLQLEQEIISLSARYAVLFLPLSGIPAALEAIEENVSTITKTIWVRAPSGGTSHPDHRKHLVDLIDPEKYKELSVACDAARDSIAGLQGGIRGALLSPLLEANIVSLSRIVRQMFQRPEDTDMLK